MKRPVFPLERAFLFFFSVSLCFSWAFFGLPLVQFLFLCPSLVLFFPSSFLYFFFCFRLVPSFSPFLSLSVFFAFVSGKITTSNIQLQSRFINPVSFFGFLSCFLFEIPFFLSLFFADCQLCFLFWFLVSKNTS